ncbi:MAG: hypothetical protein HY645_13465 [Acidobacteria bacterium]|nr:hypothetical protein [Acidobacteriota bacterium]
MSLFDCVEVSGVLLRQVDPFLVSRRRLRIGSGSPSLAGWAAHDDECALD